MRLVTAGCSFTDYCWSTWADILGEHFNNYQNFGIGGCDNATIARNVVQNAQPGDLVIVLWSSFERWSFYLEEKYPMPFDENNHWRHLGPLTIYDKTFFVNYYHKVERFQTTMDYVQLVDLHSKLNNYTVYHFPAFNWLLGQYETKIDARIEEIYKKYNIQNNYLLEESLDDYQIKRSLVVPVRHRYLPTGGDKHPLPVTQLKYLNEVMLPKLNLNIVLSDAQVDSINKEQYNIINYGKLHDD